MTSEDSLKWYECYYYVSLLDSNFRQTASNDWHNKLYHYDGTFSELFSIVLLYSLNWYFFSRNVIHLAIKFLSVHNKKKYCKFTLRFTCGHYSYCKSAYKKQGNNLPITTKAKNTKADGIIHQISSSWSKN